MDVTFLRMEKPVSHVEEGIILRTNAELFHEGGETESQLFMKPQTPSKKRTTSARLRSTNPSHEWP